MRRSSARGYRASFVLRADAPEELLALQVEPPAVQCGGGVVRVVQVIDRQLLARVARLDDVAAARRGEVERAVPGRDRAGGGRGAIETLAIDLRPVRQPPALQHARRMQAVNVWTD